MNLPKRMRVPDSIDPIRVHWLTALVVTDALCGAVTVLGVAVGHSNGASQLVMRGWVPIATPVWGGLLVASAVLVWFGLYLAGGLVGSACWLTITIASFTAAIQGVAPSWMGPPLLGGWAAFHCLITYEVRSGLDEDRERKQRA